MAQLEKLVVSLEARITQFEKAMAKARKVSDDQMSKIERRSNTLNARLAGIGKNAFGELAKGALIAAAPILGVTAAIGTATAALAEFGDIADNAKSAGLDSEFFQGIAHGAQLAGVDMATFSGALNTFNKNSGLAVENKGRMVTALKALNPELLANIQAAQSQEQRLRLAADAIQATGNAASRAALATALFGDAGFKLADAFSGGAAGIDDTVRAARELGIVIDRDLIRRSEELGDELEVAQKVMDLQFKQALVDLAPILISTARLAGNLASGINYLVESMQNLDQRGTARLRNDFESIEKTLAANQAEYSPGVVGAEAMGIQLDPAAKEKMIAERDDILAELKRRATDDLRVQLTAPRMDSVENEYEGDPGSASNKAADAAIKQAEAVQGLVADLQHEQAQLGRTAEQQELYNALKSAGVTLESAYGQEIQGAMSALQTQRLAIEGNVEAMRLFDTVSQQALQTVIDGFREGKNAGEIFGDLLASVGQQLLSIGISSLSGGLGSMLFPGLPKREHGGPVRKGQPYIVGEKRPELFVPNQSGTIVPRLPTMPQGGAGSMSVPISIYAPGADAAGLARVEHEVRKLQASMPSVVKKTVRDMRKYGQG